MSCRRRFGFFLVLVSIALFTTKAAFAGDAPPLPKAFEKASPENIKDLQEIEQHVKKLLDKIVPATVGLRIGGASGSGVIIDEEGHVLTAGHVSGKPDQDAQIILHDGKKLKGKTLGGNRGIDSGMLKITDKGEFPFVDMGTSAELKKGNWCIAIGHPNGYQNGRSPVVRVGRILEVGKDKNGQQSYLRTDCALVGGDSGGPLFDMHGKVIGIHSRIGFVMTQNLHVPVDTYTETWDKLAKGEVWGETMFGKKGGPKTTGGDAYLGVKIDPDAKDCRLLFVNPESPAGRAGLKAEDILVSIDGKKIGTSVEFEKFLAAKRPNDLIALEVRRGAAIVNYTITLGKRDSSK